MVGIINYLSIKNMKKIISIYFKLTLVALILFSCENRNIEFPDFDYQTIYFANQYPGRTITLGEHDWVDVSLDNERKVEILATTGGVYMNKSNIVVNFKIEESLCNNLYFDNGDAVIPMPTTHYKLSSNDKFTIPSGSSMGGVEVQLTDDFFADSLSLGRNYVIPLVITSMQGADSILRGTPTTENPDRCIPNHWETTPKDFVLYSVNYVNPWHGKYLRRGVDQITGSINETNVRHANYVENDEEVSIVTQSLTRASMPLTIKDEVGLDVPFTVQMTFAENETCTLSGSSSSYEVTGSGKFVKNGDKLGGKERNVLYLDYVVDFHDLNQTYTTKDTLVVRDRGIGPEYFSVERK